MTIISDTSTPTSIKPVGRHLLGHISRWIQNMQLILSIALAVVTVRILYLTAYLDGHSERLTWLIEKIMLLGPYPISSLILIATRIYGFEDRSCIKKPQKNHQSLISTALLIFLALCVYSNFGRNDNLREYLASNLHGMINNYNKDAKTREALDIIQQKFDCHGAIGNKDWTKEQTVDNISQRDKLDNNLAANQDTIHSVEMDNVTSDIFKADGCAEKMDREIGHQWLKNMGMLLFMTFFIEMAISPFTSAFTSQFLAKLTKCPLRQDNDDGNSGNGNNNNNNDEEDDDSWDNCDYVTYDCCFAKSRSNKNCNNKNGASVTDVAKENSYLKFVAGNKNFNHKREDHYLDSHKKSKKKYETAYVIRESPNSTVAKTEANLKSPKVEQVLKAKTPSKESKRQKEEQKIQKEDSEEKISLDNANKQNKVISNESEKNMFNRSPGTPFIGKNQSLSTISSKSKANTPTKSKLQNDTCQPKVNREEKLETPYYSKNGSRASDELVKQSRRENVDEGDSAERNICNSGVRARRRAPAKTLLNPAANMFNFNFNLKPREEYKVEYGYDNVAETVEGDSDEQTEGENFDETDFNVTQNASPLSSASTGDRKGSEASSSAASATTSKTKTAVTSAGTSAPPTVATSAPSTVSAASEATEKASKRRKSDRKGSKRTSGQRKSKRGKSEKSRKRPSGDKDKKSRRGTSKRKKDKKSKSPNQRSSLESLGSKRRGTKRRRAGETARRGKPFRVSPKRLSELERKFSGDPRGKPFNIDPARMDELFEKFSDEEGRPFRIHEYRMDELKEKYDDKTPYHKKGAEKVSKSRGKSDRKGKSNRKAKSKKPQKSGKDKKK